MANEKVRFGVEKVHYALMTDSGYAEPKPLPGAVSLTLTPQGDSKNFYADDRPYVTFTTNSGYTGDIELAYLDDEATKDLLNEVEDANGGLYEDADKQPAKFALLFEFKGNVEDKRVALYSCTVTRPTKSGKTTTDTTDPDTEKLNITAIPVEMTFGDETKKITKFTMVKTEENAAVYNGWYTQVVKPAAEPTVGA